MRELTEEQTELVSGGAVVKIHEVDSGSGSGGAGAGKIVIDKTSALPSLEHGAVNVFIGTGNDKIKR